MQIETLKLDWQKLDTIPKNKMEVKNMLKETRHPVLKQIRKQLIIESVVFIVLLFVYYDFFDGDRKPFYANLLLVSALLFIIIHNLIGYLLTKSSVKGINLKESLEIHLSKLKVYALVSIASRLMFTLCLLLFFTSVISFNPAKYWVLAAVILTLLIQLTVLSRIWLRRISKMKTITHSFDV